MKILTVSIAAYNVEKYLDETLKSLTDNRYVNDLEVLVVDDGSTDKTGEIAIRYQNVFPNSVKYIKKENGGHGSTINKGVELAIGKYFRVIDGDDYVDTDEFANYIEKLKACDSDVVLTNLYAVNDKGKKRLDPAMVRNGKDVFDDIIQNRELEMGYYENTRLYGLSTLTIKTKLLQSSRMKITEKCFYVDAEFIIWCIYLAQTFQYWPMRIYMYRKDENGDNSVSKKNMVRNVSMQEKVARNMLNLFDEFGKKCASEKKMALILERIIISVGATMRSYMLFDDKEDGQNHIIEFDNDIKINHPVAYKRMGKNMFLKSVRFGNHSFIPLVRFAYIKWLER